MRSFTTKVIALSAFSLLGLGATASPLPDAYKALEALPSIAAIQCSRAGANEPVITSTREANSEGRTIALNLSVLHAFGGSATDLAQDDFEISRATRTGDVLNLKGRSETGFNLELVVRLEKGAAPKTPFKAGLAIDNALQFKGLLSCMVELNSR